MSPGQQSLLSTGPTTQAVVLQEFRLLTGALDRLSAIAGKIDPADYGTAVQAVANSVIFAKPAPRHAVDKVMELALDALESVRRHGFDHIGARWTEDDVEGACALLLEVSE